MLIKGNTVPRLSENQLNSLSIAPVTIQKGKNTTVYNSVPDGIEIVDTYRNGGTTITWKTVIHREKFSQL